MRRESGSPCGSFWSSPADLVPTDSVFLAVTSVCNYVLANCNDGRRRVTARAIPNNQCDIAVHCPHSSQPHPSGESDDCCPLNEGQEGLPLVATERGFLQAAVAAPRGAASAEVALIGRTPDIAIKNVVSAEHAANERPS